MSGSYSEIIEYFSLCVMEAYQEAIDRVPGKDLLSRGWTREASDWRRRARSCGTAFTLRRPGWLESVGSRPSGPSGHLVDLGILTKEGRTAATRYRFLDPLEPFKARMKEKGYVLSGIA